MATNVQSINVWVTNIPVKNIRVKTSWSQTSRSQKGDHKRPGHKRPGHKRPGHTRLGHKRIGHKRPVTASTTLNIAFYLFVTEKLQKMRITSNRSAILNEKPSYYVTMVYALIVFLRGFVDNIIEHKY